MHCLGSLVIRVLVIATFLYSWSLETAARADTKFVTPATFESSLKGVGSSECDMDTTITFNSDGTIVERFVHDGHEVFADSGMWHIFPKSGELVLGRPPFRPDRGNLYKFIDRDTIRKIARDGVPEISECNGNLSRNAFVSMFSVSREAPRLDTERWTLIELDGKEFALTASQSPPSIAFDRHAREFAVISGCDRFTGSYRSGVYDPNLYEGGATRLHLSVRSNAMKYCGQPYATLSPQLRAAIGRTTAFHLCCGRLELLDGKVVVAKFADSR